jgi:hypothetical protein
VAAALHVMSQLGWPRPPAGAGFESALRGWWSAYGEVLVATSPELPNLTAFVGGPLATWVASANCAPPLAFCGARLRDFRATSPAMARSGFLLVCTAVPFMGQL